MESFNINFTIGSEIEYPKKILGLLEKNFYCDLSQQNLNNVFIASYCILFFTGWKLK